ncbi:MAG: DUF4304 domain-containing protein [Burkholderiales bacterium]|nr:MAG: DUF4304 domain-containing protein [Burkholderiales bacterium]
MTVRDLGTKFATQLHIECFKAEGFTKRGSTFSRDQGSHVELINIQGSDWNSGEEPWIFYINIRVRFPELTPQGSAKMAHHAEGRLNRIVCGAPPQFELTRSNFGDLVVEVGSLCQAACAALPHHLALLRARACRGLFSPIPVPDGWTTP